MATYNTAFGSLPGYNEMLGTTNTTGGGQQQVYGQRAQQQRQGQAAPAPAQTFAQLQQRGMARPAPVQGPQAQPFAQYGGSQQAAQMRQRLQEQLAAFGNQPSRYDTQAFQQIRGAQAANLQAEYQGQQKALNEELARRGLSASSVGGGRMGDLAGQQARALASLDAQMLQQAAETQAADRAQLLQAGQGLAELAGSQDLAQFEANRVAQAATFENQLRAAQFGQQQYEQAGQEALQGAQAEEAAQQAARQFDLTATGQAAGLSMDLQRLLGQQELERAQLTGTLGGQQTLAGQQQAEQRRQFDVEQQLRQFLGVGGLGLQERQQAAQEQQFGVTSAEQQRQFNIQQALQQQLGLGGLGIQQQEVALKAQQLQQEATQFGLSLNEQQASRLQQYGLSAQELGLRSQQIQQEAALQGRQMSIAEAQNQAQNSLEQQKITQQATQFGLSLTEQQIARAQQFGLSGQELALKTQELQQQAALQGRTLDLQQAQQGAQISLEQQKINQQASQFGITLSDKQQERAQQLGITYQQIAQEQQRITNQATQFGQSLSVQQVQNQAQNNLEQARINEAIASRGAQTGLEQQRINEAIAARGEGARQFNLEQSLRQALAQTEATGYFYEPMTTGASVGALGGMRATLARTAQEAAQSQATLDLNLRRQLGLSELAGYIYDVGGQTMGGQTTVGARSQQTAAQSAQYQAQLAEAQQRMAASQYQTDLITQLIAALNAARTTTTATK